MGLPYGENCVILADVVMGGAMWFDWQAAAQRRTTSWLTLNQTGMTKNESSPTSPASVSSALRTRSDPRFTSTHSIVILYSAAAHSVYSAPLGSPHPAHHLGIQTSYIVHTLFILRADDIHTVRGCGRACGHASSCVAALTREWPVLLQFLSVACSLMLCAKCAYTDRQSGERLLTDNRILFSLLVPQPKSWGDLSHPVPMVVAPMLNLLTCKWVRNIHINGWWITICICIWLDTAPHIHTGTSRPHIGQTDKHTRDCDSNYYLQRYIIDTTLYCGNSRQIHQSRRSTATVSEITIHNINSITRCQSTQIKYKPTRLHHSLSVTSHLVSKQLETNIIHGKNRATLNYYWNMGKISQNRQQQLLVTLMYMKHCYENKIYNYMKAYRTIKEDQKM